MMLSRNFLIFLILATAIHAASFKEILKEKNQPFAKQFAYGLAKIDNQFSFDGLIDTKEMARADNEGRGTFSLMSEGLRKSFEDKKVSKHLLFTQKFYQVNKYQPIWFRNGKLNALAKQACKLMRNSDDEGLNPNDYRFAAAAIREVDGSMIKMLQAEIMLTKDFLQYIDDITNGRFDPREASRDIVIRPEPVDPIAYLMDGLRSKSTKWMKQLPPPYTEYQALKKLLKHYNGQASVTDWPKITLKRGELIKVGDKHHELPKMRQLLKLLGYKSGIKDDQVYDKDFEKEIRTFQQRHGLLVDGIIGPQTFKALNMTPDERVRRIIVTMERWRWMPHNPGKRYIMVNVPSFELRAIENKKVILASNVIVGRQTRKTPFFKSIMSDIVFNPSWYVPVSIAVKDKLDKIRNDPDYITRNSYVLSDADGAIVNPHHVNWDNYGRGNFPFRLRQLPGNHNALGKIKFNMENDFSIYLHSTSNPELFKKDVRMFSSGCIRVEKVAELAQFVFNDLEAWSLEKVNQHMEGNSTNTVKLKEQLPVYITYFTVGYDSEGHQFFAPDIYGQDKQVAQVIFGHEI